MTEEGATTPIKIPFAAHSPGFKETNKGCCCVLIHSELSAYEDRAEELIEVLEKEASDFCEEDVFFVGGITASDLAHGTVAILWFSREDVSNDQEG